MLRISRMQVNSVADGTYASYHPFMDRKPTRFELRLPPELGDEIDAWRRQQDDLPNRAEAARRLIEMGLGVLPTVGKTHEARATVAQTSSEVPPKRKRAIRA